MSKNSCRNCSGRITYMVLGCPKIQIHECMTSDPTRIIGTGPDALDYLCKKWDQDRGHTEIFIIRIDFMMQKIPLYREYFYTEYKKYLQELRDENLGNHPEVEADPKS